MSQGLVLVLQRGHEPGGGGGEGRLIAFPSLSGPPEYPGLLFIACITLRQLSARTAYMSTFPSELLENRD